MASGSCSKWWQMRTNLEKTLLSFSIILFLTCIIIILVGVVRHGGVSDENEENAVCPSKFCMEKAIHMMSMLDSNVDPCDDFYEYACGQYAKKHAEPTDYWEGSVEYDAAEAVRIFLKNWLETDSNSNISIYRKAKTMYQTCMVYDQVNMKQASLLGQAMLRQKIGLWAVTDELWETTYEGLEQSLASLALLGISTVFKLDVVPDSRKPGKFIAKISPGKPQIEAHDFRIMESDLFFQYLDTTFLMLGIKKRLSNSKVEDILATESKIFSLNADAEQQCGENKSSNGDLGNIRVGNFHNISAELHSSINWGIMMGNIFKVLNLTKVPELEVDLYCKRHIRELIDYFIYSDLKTVNTYFGWRFFISFMQFLGPNFHQLVNYKKHFVSKGKSPYLPFPRWKECLSIVEKQMLPVLAYVYKEQMLTEDIIKEKVKIADAVRSSLANGLSSAMWLSVADKEWIKQKVKGSRFELPVPKLSSNISKLDELYSLLVTEKDHFLHNMLMYHQFKVMNELRQLVSPPEDYMHWDQDSLASPNAFQHIGNRIIVHYDKLQAPFLSTNHQSYLNYGAFGTFLARQLNRYLVSLDFQPSKANDTLWGLFLQKHKDGEGSCRIAGKGEGSSDAEDTRTQKEWDEFLNELNVVKSTYQAYKEQESKEQLLPSLSLTKDRLFFLSYAQTRCETRRVRSVPIDDAKAPSRQSVNFALKNLDAFSEVYSCPKNAKMNPAKRCQIWN